MQGTPHAEIMSINFIAAMQRLKAALHVNKDVEVATALGLSKAAFSERKRHGSFPEKKLRSLAEQRPELHLDVDHILTSEFSSTTAAPEENESLPEISKRLHEERKRLRLSQEKFAALGGVHRRTQTGYEKGNRNPDAAYLSAIAAAGADVLYIITGIRATITKTPEPEITSDERELLALYRAAPLLSKMNIVKRLQEQLEQELTWSDIEERIARVRDWQKKRFITNQDKQC